MNAMETAEEPLLVVRGLVLAGTTDVVGIIYFLGPWGITRSMVLYRGIVVMVAYLGKLTTGQ